jgi:predicted GNAT family N-acyltransferase
VTLFYTEPMDDPLTGAEDFDCGVESLNDWLRGPATGVERAGLGRTHLWRNGTRVVAYITLAPHDVRQEGVASRNRYGKRDRPVPGYLLARLALDKELHGQGLGTRLLTQALELVAEASQRAAGRLLVVDAIDDHAADFYRAHGFKDMRAVADDRPQRLYRPIADIIADVR